jgi:DNA-binding Lrp family transcriptional regulator
MGHRIDEIDRLILYHLAVDARNTSAPTIAEEVDVTPGTIRNRIRQLEDHGIIEGYHAAIDYEATDGKVTTQFTCTVPVSERAAIARETLALPGVVNVRELLAGQDNLLVTVVGENTDDIDRVARRLADVGVTIKREDILRNESFQPYDGFAPSGEDPQPAVRDFQNVVGGAEVVECTVAADAEICDMTLAEANAAGLLDDDVLVVSIERGEDRVTPSGDTTIQAGDVVSIFSATEFPDHLLAAFDESATAHQTDQRAER